MPQTLLAPQSIRHPLIRRRAAVSAVRPVAGPFVRVTLTGPELGGFVAAGPADHVKLFFPTGGEPVARDYTPLDYRPGRDGRDPELDIDFVVHGDEGPASRWVLTAEPGDELELAGPRGSRLVPEGIRRLIVVADETALPAASRWARLVPPGTRVELLLFVADVATASYLDGVGAAELRVVTGVDAARLESEVRALAPFYGGTVVFLAGEAGALVPSRRYLRHELGLSRDQATVSGYWRRGVSGLDHHAPLDPADPD